MIKQHATPANHHLSTIVISLTAILLALGIYTYVYSHRTTDTTGAASTTTTPTVNAAPIPDTISGARSFTGTIKSLQGQNQLTVTTVTITKGVPKTSVVIVNYTKQTTVKKFTYPKGSGEVIQSASDTAEVKADTPVQIYTKEIVGSTSPLTAQEIDVLPS